MKLPFIKMTTLLALLLSTSLIASDNQEDHDKETLLFASEEETTKEEAFLLVSEDETKEEATLLAEAEEDDALFARCRCRDKNKKKVILMAKACAEGGCPIQMIERLREEKRLEREKLKAKSASTESPETQDTAQAEEETA